MRENSIKGLNDFRIGQKAHRRDMVEIGSKSSNCITLKLLVLHLLQSRYNMKYIII